jgi:hypothetical protein
MPDLSSKGKDAGFSEQDSAMVEAPPRYVSSRCNSVPQPDLERMGELLLSWQQGQSFPLCRLQGPESVVAMGVQAPSSQRQRVDCCPQILQARLWGLEIQNNG